MLTDHVPDRELLLAFDGELSPDGIAAVRAHTKECPSCESRWIHLTALSGELVAARPAVSLQPEETAVRSFRARLEDVESTTGWLSRSRVFSKMLKSTAFANSLAAVAAACACILLLPSVRMANRAADHPAARSNPVYDFEQTVPQGYLSLPFADPALPLDDATVLPVELSAEDLELLGIPSTEVPAGSDIQAELLLGVDGWPRAIRIVDQY